MGLAPLYVITRVCVSLESLGRLARASWGPEEGHRKFAAFGDQYFRSWRNVEEARTEKEASQMFLLIRSQMYVKSR